ncbi:MAG: hypothetical protein IPM25_11605 [Chloracidobacterium sp.]|nr:hypothetical protein [Chloracidobacterium sp.]
MRFLNYLRLLLLGVWLGAAVFFIGVAQSAFALLPTRELAGSIVNRNLMFLNLAGLGIGVLLLLLSLVAARNSNRALLWAERFFLFVLAGACAVGQFVIALWLQLTKAQMGGVPIDQVAVDDPLRVQFNAIHEYSVWVLAAGMFAALVAFFVAAFRHSATGGSGSATTSDPFDFSKEFKKT